MGWGGCGKDWGSSDGGWGAAAGGGAWGGGDGGWGGGKGCGGGCGKGGGWGGDGGKGFGGGCKGGKGYGAGGGKGAGPGSSWGGAGVWQPMFNPMLAMMMKGMGKVNTGLRNFANEKKVFIGGMPENNVSKDINMKLKDHMSSTGVTCLYAEIGRSGTGGAAFKSNSEAQTVAAALNGSSFEGYTLQAAQDELGSETLGAKLSIAEAEKSELEQEKSVLEAQLEQLQVQISARTAEVEAIKAQADEAKASGVGDPLGFQRGLQALETADVEELGSKWKEQGKKAVEDAQARAAAVTQKTTEELDRLLARFMELVQQVQDSQAFQSASSQLQTATEQTMASAQQLSAAAAPALQQGMASASQAAQQGMQTASQAVAQAKEAMS
ncbi:unnamed protein product [Durusdinium trenchii]|uniref:RRM domain-containing protein n=1 Tax=Durusdinium trenchii TaxID=1381693 RepID=A0ABP0QD40_9DINO